MFAAVSLDDQLIASVQQGDAVAVAKLLARGASPNAVDEDDEPAWVTAIANDHVTIIDALLRAGCDIDPLQALHEVRGLAMLRRLLAHGTDINARESDGSTALYLMRSERLVEAFLEAGADPNLATANHETPLTFHASWGNLALVELLLRHGADPNYIDPEVHFSVLDYAASWGHRNIVESLLDEGADLHRRDNGVSALTHALRGGHLGVAELLVAKGATLGDYDLEALDSLAARIAKLRAGDSKP